MFAGACCWLLFVVRSASLAVRCWSLFVVCCVVFII